MSDYWRNPELVKEGDSINVAEEGRRLLHRGLA